ncbi:hypothetical protein DFH27DRAFT_523758 [Peziza echinospora]|nr:hypothetical protein DFH27DRAFT_523758 [Peziza echinospora]
MVLVCPLTLVLVALFVVYSFTYLPWPYFNYRALASGLPKIQVLISLDPELRSRMAATVLAAVLFFVCRSSLKLFSEICSRREEGNIDVLGYYSCRGLKLPTDTVDSGDVDAYDEYSHNGGGSDDHDDEIQAHAWRLGRPGQNYTYAPRTPSWKV